MTAQHAAQADDLLASEMLDVETSAAILRWLDTATVPPGVDPQRWELWAADGCEGPLEANGVLVTPASSP